MTTRRHVSGFLLAATLLASACGGGDDGNSTVAPEPTEAPVPVDTGEEEASASFVGLEIVWALDDEPVAAEFDYTEPIARDRFDAGLRLDATFETTGDVGDIDTSELRLPVTINGDEIRGGSRLGPENSYTRPDPEDVTIVETDNGFIAQFPIGRPLSPISLVTARERSAASTFDLDPDEEVLDLGDDVTFDVARLIDIPAAPVGGRNQYLIAVTGSIRLGNGFTLDVGEQVEELTISETSTVEVNASADCAAQGTRYLELLDEELAEPDVVLLDRLRAFEYLEAFERGNDCDPRDFAIPVCDAATAATAPEAVLERHLWICPDERDMVDATVFEPRFEDGVVRLVIPATADGLPAYSVAMSWPDWTVETTSEGANRQKIALSADPDTVGRFTRLDIDVSAMPASLLEERAAAAVEPEAPDAERLVDDTTTIGGVPARRLIARLQPDTPVYQVGTAVEIDSERLLTITGVVTGTADLPVDSDGITALMACIEASMVIVEYDPDVEPAPAGDCTAITELSLTGATADAGVSLPAATFDGSTIMLTVPRSDNGPAHVITVSTPAWTLDTVRETDSTQSVKIDAEETFTFVSARGGFIVDYEASADDEAEPFDEDWTTVSDETRTIGAREYRLVKTEKESATGAFNRKGKIITELDENHMLVVEVNIAASAAAIHDFDAIFATALESLTITP